MAEMFGLLFARAGDRKGCSGWGKPAPFARGQFVLLCQGLRCTLDGCSRARYAVKRPKQPAWVANSFELNEVSGVGLRLIRKALQVPN